MTATFVGGPLNGQVAVTSGAHIYVAYQAPVIDMDNPEAPVIPIELRYYRVPGTDYYVFEPYFNTNHL